ncbi:hypothetical protein EsH8_III_001497 [Colletotrichum jinshuiense]
MTVVHTSPTVLISPAASKCNELRLMSTAADPTYWWRTSGQDLQNMMKEADYPEEIQHQFLQYYREAMCTQLGAKPEANSIKAVTGWDGNPFEYSFELKGTTKNPGVRFVVDFSPLRPAKNGTMFDDTWHQSLAQWFVYSHLPPSQQHAMIAEQKHQTSLIVGFDVARRVLIPGKLPVMAKSYFHPGFAAADRCISHWDALASGIRQLPNFASYPNIEKALAMMEEYLLEHPEHASGTRGVSVDCVPQGKARLKIYMRYHGDSFEEIWDYYTLGGRIPDLEEDKAKFSDLMELTNGAGYEAGIGEHIQQDQEKPTMLRHKPLAIYFSLSPEKPYPIPKVYFTPARKAPNDKAIALGLDKWLDKYGWYDGGKTIEERVSNTL